MKWRIALGPLPVAMWAVLVPGLALSLHGQQPTSAPHRRKLMSLRMISTCLMPSCRATMIEVDPILWTGFRHS